MKLDEETLRKLFPNLAKELGSTRNKVSITSVRTDTQTGEETASRGFSHYQPDVIDFIRRSDTKEEAKEIINYMKKRGEIEPQYAKRLKKQLEEKGVRSFGSKKKENYYFEHRE
ncbi:MAG: DUF2095 domain-containing protein [Candidatus Korarchaeota archaeon]|nr:DUF2095 domain-containing protein [Candidatus Korarchaeota archaeon]NIU84821.1 DUF2095 domain-containing protein [Candidatus Thorarchaeota archaeon]NIW14829.1 DUF2095 domain-containing protein [Candidatus Thorarchaeota archaeon]NIW52879.1 DUF2095 domain-containing protein [Candidatus Korarchaeota archaeon]